MQESQQQVRGRPKYQTYQNFKGRKSNSLMNLCGKKHHSDLEIRSISLLYRATVLMFPVYIYLQYYHIVCRDFCRQSSTHTRALTRTYMYVVAWWQAEESTQVAVIPNDSYTRTTIVYAFFLFFSICLSKVPPTRLDDERTESRFSLVLNQRHTIYVWFLRFLISSTPPLRWNFVLSFS